MRSSVSSFEMLLANSGIRAAADCILFSSTVSAPPKGLRHFFGVHCAFSNIPISLCQRWMGHADMRTTAIYYQIVGKEEREMAKRMWS